MRRHGGTAWVNGGMVLSALLCLLAWSGPLGGRRAIADEPAARETALLLGSSSVGGHLGHTLERELGTLGLDVELRRRSSTGLARPDFYDWPRSVRRGPSFVGHVGVMVLMGGNDAQPVRVMQGQRRVATVRWDHEAAWRETYAGLVQAFGRELCERGARRVVWLLPPNPGQSSWNEKLARVRTVQREAASTIRCAGDVAAVVIDADDPQAPFGARETSDGIHLNRVGARRYWEQVGAAITRALGVTVPTPPEEPADAP